jgi:cytidine deaminase
MHELLIAEARQARGFAIAPYSHFAVGAALQTVDGRIYRGCNVENASFGLTVCAERVALLTALAAGDRGFSALAVMTTPDPPSPPCGPCRQLLWEYCGNITVILTNPSGITRQFSLSQLFPHPFELKAEP